jgi:thiamine transport system substrate-binding protein
LGDRELGETGLRGSLPGSDRSNLKRVMPAQGLAHLLPERRLMRRHALPIVIALWAIAGCSDSSPDTITLLSYDSFKAAVTDETFAGFTEATGVDVEVIASGDAGAMVNQAILSKDNPLADVLFGVDDTFLSRAIEGGIFVPHRAAGVETVDPDLLVADDLVTPIDFGDVCVNYDIAWFADAGTDIPRSLDDLRRQAHLLAVQHPATSSPGLAFVLGTIGVYGEEGWLDFWADLREGGVEVTSSWDDAYYASFTRYGGDRPLVVSYASSPPAEVMFAEDPPEDAPTGVMTDGCYRQVEYAGVLAGTEHGDIAGQLVDYLLTVEFQEQVPESWFVFPVNRDAALSPVFERHAVIPEDPVRLDAETIAANRDRWIDEWIAVMEQG